MTTIFDCYSLIQFICNKQKAGAPSPTDVSRALDAAQLNLFKYFKERGNEDALRNFIKSSNLTTTSSGLLAYPNDHAETLSLDETLSGIYKGIVEIEESQLQEALASVLYPIAANPRFIRSQAGIQIYPVDTHSVSLRYLAVPTTPFCAVTVSGNTITYNAAGSTQLQFSANYWIDIIHLALPYIGVNLSSEQLTSLVQLFNTAQR